MTVWLLGFFVGAAVVGGLALAGVLNVRRYSSRHLTAQLAVSGRGVFFSRTPDGVWWRLRLRPCRRRYEDRSGWPDAPPDGGVREPRPPRGPSPLSAAVRLDPPL